MKTGSEKRMVKRGDGRENTPAGKVGQPEKDLAYEKPVKVAEGKVKPGFVRMSVHRAFQLTSNPEVGGDGKVYGAKEGDVIDVPNDVAEELDRGFKTFYKHRGMINVENAERREIKRASRI